jgi:hypothetical protein
MFFSSKVYLSLVKDVQATREAFGPQKRTSSISKHEISKLFSIFVGNFCPSAFQCCQKWGGTLEMKGIQNKKP